jgi:hypothetical protein
LPTIRHFLDLSTAHLAPAGQSYLDSCADPASASCLPACKTAYGWFVYATDDPGAYSEAELPPHLRRICAYARAHGCDYILFDADAPADNELPTFDEDTGAESVHASQPATDSGTGIMSGSCEGRRDYSIEEGSNPDTIVTGGPIPFEHSEEAAFGAGVLRDALIAALPELEVEVERLERSNSGERLDRLRAIVAQIRKAIGSDQPSTTPGG